MISRRQSRAIAAWLGLFAFFLQSLIPLLVAAEISLAANAGEHSVFELCPMGHVHGAADQHPGGSGKSQGDDDGCGLCPICLALHASPVFTAPAVAALPVPIVHAIVTAAVAPHQIPRLVATAAYRSRAPPLG
ncbi:MAG TPA: DUF2946 domain-containing protein [Stellaceae bacterium]|nr:DUF2946 domain-containing protein [Stellaceae bacterium]